MFSTLFNQLRSSVFGIQSSPIRSEYERIVAEFYALHRSENHSALLAITDAEGNLTYANGNFCKLSLYPLHELLGKPHSFMLTPEDAVTIVADMQRTFAAGKVWQGIIKCTDKSGHIKSLSALISPVLDNAGKTTRYVNIWKQINSDPSSSAA